MDDTDDLPRADAAGEEPPDNTGTVTVSCTRCDREWDLEPELATAGNQALEQFALEHRQHTGHFPDDVTTWRAACRHCPEQAERLSEEAARRWARTHARHTRHDVALRGGEHDGNDLVESR